MNDEILKSADTKDLGAVTRSDIEKMSKFFPSRISVGDEHLEALRKFSEKHDVIGPMGARICNGPACPLVRDRNRMSDPEAPRDLTNCNCPLYEAGLEPINFPCPLEALEHDKLVTVIRESLNIAPENISDSIIVAELVDLILLKNRTMKELSAEGSMLLEEITNGDGFVNIKRIEHPLISTIATLTTLISKKRSELIATPERRNSAKVNNARATKDIVDASAKLKEIFGRRSKPSKEEKVSIVQQALSVELDDEEVDPEIERMKIAELSKHQKSFVYQEDDDDDGEG